MPSAPSIVHPDAEPKIFYEGGDPAPFKKHKAPFLSDEVYGQAIRGLQVVCVDVVLVDVDKQTFLLPTRIINAAKGPWLFGGRQRPWETPREAIHRCFQGETGVDLPSSALSFVTICSSMWHLRELEPKEAGQHDVIFVYATSFSEAELEKVKQGLSDEEYDMDACIQIFNRDRLIAECKYRPQLLYYYEKIFGVKC